MNILGRYGNSGIDIEGTEESLRELSCVLEGLSSDKVFPLSGNRPSQDPYPGHAKTLRLALSNEPVCIALAGDEISVCGAADKLRILAQNIRLLADQQKQESSGRTRLHSHIEYYPGHFFLKAESIPLVVAKTDSRST